MEGKDQKVDENELNRSLNLIENCHILRRKKEKMGEKWFDILKVGRGA